MSNDQREYRKTAMIKAVQWWQMGDHPAVVLKSDPNRYADEGVPWIETLEGGHVVTPGDWIATGVNGEHWPIKPDIFAKTYEPVERLRSLGGEGEGDIGKGNRDCLAKRRPGEPMFILLGRDPDAHNIVRSWAQRRLSAGGDPGHCNPVLALADRMQAYAADRANAPASAPPANAYPASKQVMDRESVERVIAEYQIGMGLSEEDAWSDAHGIGAAILSLASPAVAEDGGARERCDWPTGQFTFHDDPGEHDPCYVVMPCGASLPLNHHAGEGVDIARAKFIIAACNDALLSKPRYLSDHFRYAAPGDRQEDVWLVRFDDADRRDMLFRGDDAEAEAWAAWEQFAPSWNCYVFRLAALSTPTAPAVEDGFVVVPKEPTSAWAALVAEIRQGRKSSPRCEPPGEYETNWARDCIAAVLEAAAMIAAPPAKGAGE